MIYQHLKTTRRDGDQEFPAIRIRVEIGCDWQFCPIAPE